MGKHRPFGGCGGDFPEPEIDKEKKAKEEKGCCHGGCVQCNSETGCGLGPAQEGSVQDASGAPVLSQKTETRAKAEYLIVTQDGEYLVDLCDPCQFHHERRNLMDFVAGHKLADYGHTIIFGLKRTEVSYKYHRLYSNTILRVIPWNLEKWKAETSEGII